MKKTITLDEGVVAGVQALAEKDVNDVRSFSAIASMLLKEALWARLRIRTTSGDGDFVVKGETDV